MMLKNYESQENGFYTHNIYNDFNNIIDLHERNVNY